MAKRTNRGAPYTDVRLSIVQTDSDNMLPSCEETFLEGADLNEGVAGLKAIDTSYENTSQAEVESPKSTREGLGDATVRHPAPVDIDLVRYPHRRY